MKILRKVVTKGSIPGIPGHALNTGYTACIVTGKDQACLGMSVCVFGHDGCWQDRLKRSLNIQMC